MIEIINCGMVNCYLIRGKNGSILVDTGNPGDGERIYETVKDKQVKLILLTHGHIDHIGNTSYLKEKLHVPVAMHEADYRLSKDNTLGKCMANTLIGKVVLTFSKPSFKKKAEPFEPDLFMEDKDDLRKYGVSAEVMALPGHTEGSIGVWTTNGVIVGDAMMNFIRPYGARLYSDKDAARSSLDKIKSTEVLMIYPGHGKPIELNRFFK